MLPGLNEFASTSKHAITLMRQVSKSPIIEPLQVSVDCVDDENNLRSATKRKRWAASACICKLIMILTLLFVLK